MPSAGASPNRDVDLRHVFRGGPWDGQTKDRQRVFGVGAHCVPNPDGVYATWGESFMWQPSQHRYVPVTGPDVEPVVMVWSLPGDPALAAGEGVSVTDEVIERLAAKAGEGYELSPKIVASDVAAAVSAFEYAVGVIDRSLHTISRLPAGLLAPYRDPDEPEVLGPFKIYQPTDWSQRDGAAGRGWAVSYGGAWLPGRYADRDAALLVCGYVLGGESRDKLYAVSDRAGARLITVQDLASLPPRTGPSRLSARQAAAAAGQALAWDRPTRRVLFEGGPWDQQWREQPAVLAVDQHCMLRAVDDDELGESWAEVWAAADSWPGQERYRPVDIEMGTGEVVMQWSHATAEEIARARQRRLEHAEARARDDAQAAGRDETA